MKEKKLAVLGLPEVNLAIRHWNITSESPSNQKEPHTHKDCEVYINLSGDVSFEVGNHIYPISRGSVIVTRPYEYHRCIYRSNAQHEHFWITFSTDDPETLLDLLYSREKVRSNLILLNEAGVDEVCTVLQDMLDTGSDPLKNGIGFLRLVRILREGRLGEYGDSIETSWGDVSVALRYMDEHLTEDIDIRLLCSACNMSVNTLERHFKTVMGVSPMEVLRKKRLILSMDYLRNGYTVTEAAMKSGFRDYSNYIQMFRKRFGFTPLKYKKSWMEM